MPNLATALTALILFAGLAPQDAAPPKAVPPDAARAELEGLAWMEGTWRIQHGGTVTEERWLPLAGTTLLGLSHTYDEKRTHFFEFLRITVQHGKVAYVAQPGGRPPVPFLAAKLADGEAVFENPEHDHPQRIRYVRTEKGLTATISLLDGSRAQVFEFERR